MARKVVKSKNDGKSTASHVQTNEKLALRRTRHNIIRRVNKSGQRRHHSKSSNRSILYPITTLILIVAIIASIPLLAPILIAPPGRFVAPIQVSSPNYGAAITPTAGSGNSSSPSYGADIIAGQPVAGTSSSSSYVANYGVQNYIFPTEVVAGAPVASGQSASPGSPTTYSPTQTYNFSIQWTPSENASITQVVFRLFKSGTLISTKTLTGGEIILSAGVYSTTYTGLAGGSYTYDWFASDSNGLTTLTSTFAYQINAVGTTTSMTLNGVAANITADASSIVTIVVTSSQPSLPVSLQANFTGTLETIATGTGNLTYAFNTSAVAGTNWRFRGVTTGNENFTSSFINLTVKLKTPTTTVLLIDGLPLSKLYPSTGPIVVINASVPVTGATVCINVTKPGGSTSQQCGVQPQSKSEFLDQTGLYTVRGFFLGTAEFAASSKTLYIFVGSDTAFPQWSDQSQSAPSVTSGLNISFSATLSDDTFVHTAILQTNVTGTFENVSSQYIGAPSMAVSFAFSTTVQASSHAWRIVFNDSAGNQNATDVANFAVVPPVPANISIVTVPSGANISVNGILVGASPITASVLTGSHTIAFGPLATYSTPASQVIQVNASDIGTVLVVNVSYFDPSDANKDRVINTTELNTAISQWKSGTLSISQLIATIGRWKLSPSAYP